MKALTALAIITLWAGLTPAFAQSGNAPGPKTAAIMLCRLGLGPAGCDRILLGGRWNMRWIKRCNGPYSDLKYCPLGELETVKYFGTQKDGYDVYDVKYMNAEVSVVIALARPDGKADKVLTFPGPPTQPLPLPKLAIKSPANPVQVLFSQQQFGT